MLLLDHTSANCLHNDYFEGNLFRSKLSPNCAAIKSLKDSSPPKLKQEREIEIALGKFQQLTQLSGTL